MHSIFKIPFNITLLFLLFTFNCHAVNIDLSDKINSEQKKIMYQDFKVLESIDLSSTPHTDRLHLLKVMEIDSLSELTLIDWLERRVRVILAQNEFKETPSVDNGPILIISNLGAKLYKLDQGKFNIPQIITRIDDKEKKIFITSPRVGILKLGKAYFLESYDLITSKMKTIANSYLRLSYLFHEARHSDGHGTSLGFYHESCPIGHDMEMLPACDYNLNGPYTIEALLKKTFLQKCMDCDETVKSVLKISYLDSLNRVIKTKRADPNFKLNQQIKQKNLLMVQFMKNILSGKSTSQIETKMNKVTKAIKRLSLSRKSNIIINSKFWNTEPVL